MRITIYDEELLFSEALAVLFIRLGHDIVGCPTTVSEYQRINADDVTEACLVSLNAIDETELRLIRTLRAISPDVAIVTLGSSDDLDSLLCTLEAGADGICLKFDGIGEIETILQKCISGRTEGRRGPSSTWSRSAAIAAHGKRSLEQRIVLTPKERLVLELLTHGASTAKIAAELGVGEATVRTHLQHLFTKFDVHSRLALVAQAVRSEVVRIGEVGQPFEHLVSAVNP